MKIIGVEHVTRKFTNYKHLSLPFKEQRSIPKTENVKKAVLLVKGSGARKVALEDRVKDEFGPPENSGQRFWKALELSLRRNKIETVGGKTLAHSVAHQSILSLLQLAGELKEKTEGKALMPDDYVNVDTIKKKFSKRFRDLEKGVQDANALLARAVFERVVLPSRIKVSDLTEMHYGIAYRITNAMIEEAKRQGAEVLVVGNAHASHALEMGGHEILNSNPPLSESDRREAIMHKACYEKHKAKIETIIRAFGG